MGWNARWFVTLCEANPRSLTYPELVLYNHTTGKNAPEEEKLPDEVNFQTKIKRRSADATKTHTSDGGRIWKGSVARWVAFLSITYLAVPSDIPHPFPGRMSLFLKSNSDGKGHTGSHTVVCLSIAALIT